MRIDTYLSNTAILTCTNSPACILTRYTPLAAEPAFHSRASIDIRSTMSQAPPPTGQRQFQPP